MAKRKIKKIKRKLKIKNIIITLILLIIILNGVWLFLELPVKNIYIIGNNIISDNDIMEESNISNYPSFLLTSGFDIKSKLKNNPYIKSVKIKKKWWGKLYLYIKEYNPLCIDINTGKVILENGQQVENKYQIDEVPFLINDVSSIYNNFIKRFSSINKDILLQISQIEYSPVNVDNERFYLAMNDGNYVYITLTKIKRLNKYGEMRQEMNGKHGIIYLDSGNYIELKD